MTFRVFFLFTLTLTFLASGAAAQCTTAPAPLVVPTLGDPRGTPPIGANSIAQTFVAPGTGCLQVQSVQVQVKGDSPLGDLVVGIYTVDGTGKPAGATGGSTAIQLFDSGGSYVSKTAIFAAPVQVTGGAAYAVVFSQPATTNGSHNYDLRAMQRPGDGPYPGGMLWVGKAGAWDAQANRDVLMTVAFTCCPSGCTHSQGYWKNHYPAFWPTFTTLTLGSVAYTPAQLETIFQLPVTGNGLISLAHQLIAARLNILAGAPQASISATLASADALIGSQNVLASGYLHPSLTGDLTTTLDYYNNGVLAGGPPKCPENQ